MGHGISKSKVVGSSHKFSIYAIWKRTRSRGQKQPKAKQTKIVIFRFIWRTPITTKWQSIRTKEVHSHFYSVSWLVSVVAVVRCLFVFNLSINIIYIIHTWPYKDIISLIRTFLLRLKMIICKTNDSRFLYYSANYSAERDTAVSFINIFFCLLPAEMNWI